MEVWKYLGEVAVDFLTRLFNRILETDKMRDVGRKSVLPIYKKCELYQLQRDKVDEPHNEYLGKSS